VLHGDIVEDVVVQNLLKIVSEQLHGLLTAKQILGPVTPDAAGGVQLPIIGPYAKGLLSDGLTARPLLGLALLLLSTNSVACNSVAKVRWVASLIASVLHNLCSNDPLSTYALTPIRCPRCRYFLTHALT
jgi:hypothetical protein